MSRWSRRCRACVAVCLGLSSRTVTRWLWLTVPLGLSLGMSACRRASSPHVESSARGQRRSTEGASFERRCDGLCGAHPGAGVPSAEIVRVGSDCSGCRDAWASLTGAVSDATELRLQLMAAASGQLVVGWIEPASLDSSEPSRATSDADQREPLGDRESRPLGSTTLTRAEQAWIRDWLGVGGRAE